MSSGLTPGSATITSTPASVSKTSIGGSQPSTAGGNARPARGFARGIVAIICTHIASAIDLGIGFPWILRRPGALPAASFREGRRTSKKSIDIVATSEKAGGALQRRQVRWRGTSRSYADFQL
jgi:hypothetical protein